MQRILTQKGVAIVEFTIVLPLLLLLMLAIAEFGRALYQYNALTKAVRDGARFMSENAFIGDSGQVSTVAPTEAKRLVAYGAIGAVVCGAYGVCQDLPDFEEDHVNTPTLYQDAAGDYYITVSSSAYTYQPMLGNLLPLTSIAVNIPLRASTTMRVL